MTTETGQTKIQFWMYWIFWSFLIIPWSYFASLIVVLLVHGVFGFNQMEGGTYLSQTVMQVAGGAVLGLGTGMYQKHLLKKSFNVSRSWIYILTIGFAVTELIVCLILWKLKINRYELRFVEGNPLPEALIFSCAGLIVGIAQWRILRRYFSGSAFWILSSTLGWGICILVTTISVLAFFAGTLLYGAITGAAVTWILRRKED